MPVNADSLELFMFELVNEERTSRGLNPLKLERNLNLSAENHSKWILQTDTFSHTGKGNSTATERIDAEFDLSGSWRTAENIAIQSERGASGFKDDVADLHIALMNSPGHRANLLNPDLVYIGIGVESGDFVFDNSGRYFSINVTQNFATTQGSVDLDLGAFQYFTNAVDTVTLSEGGTFFALGGNDTIYGTSSGETINGGAGKDKLFGRSGNDFLNGDGNDDRLYDGSGNDTVNGGSGNDYFRVGGGKDVFDGGSGKDYISYYDSSGGITANLGKDTISGSWANNDQIRNFESITGSNTGDDVITGTTGSNTIKTYGGDDRVYALAGKDKIDLGSGNDFVRVGGGKESFDGGSGKDYISYYDSAGGITANLGEDTISGSWADSDLIKNFESISGSRTGDDVITGTTGSNTIRTYGGDDRVYALAGRDKIDLGSGNDFVRAGGGRESFEGGSGKDYISYYGSSGGITANLGEDTISGAWADNDQIKSFESISGSRTGDDVITGTTGSNTIKTYGGDDRVYALGGTDKIDLGSGNDYVRVGGGKESFDGGSGKDYISYYDSADGITANLGTDTISGSWANNDQIRNFESISGSRTGDDVITGTTGSNTIKTFGGDDKLYGLGGRDKLYGGDGEDFFDGGAGVDLLWGGEDGDVFHFDRGDGQDTIKDFENNIDTIELDNFGFSKTQAFARAVESSGNVTFDFGDEGLLIVENASIAQLLNDLEIV